MLKFTTPLHPCGVLYSLVDPVDNDASLVFYDLVAHIVAHSDKPCDTPTQRWSLRKCVSTRYPLNRGIVDVLMLSMEYPDNLSKFSIWKI